MKLHPYQEIGRDFLASKKHAILADEMGLGKSAQAITAADKINAKSILIVCRAVARANWKNEIQLFGIRQRNVRVISGLRIPEDSIAADSITVCSYEGIDSVLKWVGDSFRFDLVVIDESHFVKSVDSKRSALVFGNEGLVRRSERMWLLTGTPTPNNYSELWLPLYVFGVTKLTREAFIEKFCITVKTGYGVKIVDSRCDSRTLLELKSMLKQIMLKRELTDSGLNLPPLSLENIIVEAGPVLAWAHREFKKYAYGTGPAELKAKLEAEYSLLNSILETHAMSPELLEIIKAQVQSIATLRRYIGLQKVQPAIDLLSGELESNPKMKVVVFALHRDCITYLSDKLRRFGAVTVWGGSNPKNVARDIASFQNMDSKCQVFIGQTHAAGTSINLTAAHEVVIMEKDWVPANNAQAIARCLRIGQKKPVRVRFITVDDPLDLRISELVQNKTRSLTKLYEKELGFSDLI